MPVFIDESKVPKEYVCAVCQHPWNPDSCLACDSCEDVYCTACVEDMFAKGQKCLNAQCTSVFDADKFTAVHRTVRNLADSQVPVKCANFVYGCDWEGVRTAAVPHESKCTRSKPQPRLYVGPVAEDLLCPICHEPFEDPAQLQGCDHIFCEACLKSALSTTPEKCPVCSVTTPGSQLGKVPKQIRAAVDNLQVHCLYSDKGCKVILPRKDYTAHVRACPTTVVASPKGTTTVTTPSAAVATAPPAPATTPAVPTCKVEAINQYASVQELQSEEQKIATMIHIEAPVIQSLDERRQGVTVSAVIDVSGSMSGSKLQLVQESLEFMVAELTADDSFGIISFSTNVAEELPIRKMDQAGKSEAERIIRAMKATDCTNLSGGLFSGINQVCGIPFDQGVATGSTQRRKSPPSNAAAAANAPAKKSGFFRTLFSSSSSSHVDPDNTSRPADSKAAPTAVILFTDGQANEGITDRTQLLSVLKDRLVLCPHVVVHTMGFGSDHDANLLQSIAEQGQGSYYYIKDQSVVKESFADCLGGLVSVVCTGIRIIMKIVNSDACTVDQLLTKYPVEKSGTTWTLSVKDMYSGEARDFPVLLKVTTSKVNAGSALPLLSWEVSYHSTVDGQDHVDRQTSTVAVSKDKCTDKPNVQLDEQCNRFIAAQAIEEARKAAEAQDFVRAQANLQRAKLTIANTASAQTAYSCALQNEMDLMEANVESNETYQRVGQQGMNQALNRHQQQRCNSASEGAMYETSWKAAMKKK